MSTLFGIGLFVALLGILGLLFVLRKRSIRKRDEEHLVRVKQCREEVVAARKKWIEEFREHLEKCDVQDL